jgi:glycosyltransferase involved in cell wall biosynthesis
MRIGLDASRATVAHRTGTESYALNLIRGMLAQAEGAHDFILYFRDSPAPGLFLSGARRVIPFPRLWSHARLSFELVTARPRPEVLFVPAHVLPLLHPMPSVVTVHDLGYKHFPGAHPFNQRLYLDWSTRFSARAATHLIADSLATQTDLIRCYGVPQHKITVVYPGRDETLRRVDPAAVRARYGLPDDYLLHVGTLQPRKNIVRLIEAYQSSVQGSQSRVGLVLAGKAGWLSQPIVTKAREAGARILDYVPDEDLAGLYSGARAFVFPSLYEGFGFPLLEAMACGAPVICSSTSSLPELAGQAALLVDPTDVHALAEAITRILSEPGLGAALAEKGYPQVQKFSWARAAREALAVLERTARAYRRPAGPAQQ